MNNKLRITFTHLPENLPQGFLKNDNAWGKCECSILNNENQPEKLVIIEWHMLHIIKWLIYDYYPNTYGIYPELQLGESTAEAVNRIGAVYKTDDNISQEYFSKLRRFVKYHSLNFGFPSISVPNIYIAFNGKSGEISYDPTYHVRQPNVGRTEVKMGSWSYPFDVKDFLENLFEELKQFLGEWEKQDNLLVIDVLKTDLGKVDARNK